MNKLRGFLLSEYHNQSIYYQRKAFYVIAFAGMLLLFVLLAAIIDVVVGRFTLFKAIEFGFYFLGIFVAYSLFQYGHLETTTNIFVLLGFIRISITVFHDQSAFVMIIITMISILTAAVIHVKKYQLYIVFGFYIMIYVYNIIYIYGEYKNGFASNLYLADMVYGLISMFIFMTMCWFLVHIIDNEIERSSDLEAARMTSVLYFEELEKLSSKLEGMAITDKLTGILNRRKFLEIINEEIQKCNRYRMPLALLMLDIDHFKEVNDQYGHAIGDQVLVELVNEVSRNLRLTDSFFRWGGEEFIIVMTECDFQMAYGLSEKIRKCIETHNFENVDQVTISIGVVAYEQGESIEAVMMRLDKNVYKAKNNGRNQVVG